MLGVRFWNMFNYHDNIWSGDYTGQYHYDGDGWYAPDFNYYRIGDGYYKESYHDYDVNCIYYVKH